MRKLSWVAAIALLLVGITSAFNPAAAEETAAEDAANEPTNPSVGTVRADYAGNPLGEECEAEGDEHPTEPDGPPLALRERIADLEAELVELRRQLDAMSAGTQKEGGGQQISDEERRDLIERIAEAEEDLAELRAELNGKPSWAGWKLTLYGAGLSWPVMNGASSPTVLRLVEVDGRYVWLNHLGLGASASVLGFWFTDDDQGDSAQPWTGTGHLYAAADWAWLAVTVGPEVSYFQNPTDDEQGFVVVSTPASVELRPWEWLVLRGHVGPAIDTELKRHGGLWFGFTVGTPLRPKWWENHNRR